MKYKLLISISLILIMLLVIIGISVARLKQRGELMKMKDTAYIISMTVKEFVLSHKRYPTNIEDLLYNIDSGNTQIFNLSPETKLYYNPPVSQNSNLLLFSNKNMEIYVNKDYKQDVIMK